MPSQKISRLLVLLPVILFLFASCFGVSNNPKTTSHDLIYHNNTKYHKPLYFEKGTNIPFTGTYSSLSDYNQVTVEFTDGLMDGDFVRLNLQGDTVEHYRYEAGEQTYGLSFQRNVDGTGVTRAVEVIQPTKQEDLELYEKVGELLLAKDYSGLEGFLQPETFVKAFDPDLYNYQKHLATYTQLFGPLQNVSVKEAFNTYHVLEDDEHLKGILELEFEGKTLEAILYVYRNNAGGINGKALYIQHIEEDISDAVAEGRVEANAQFLNVQIVGNAAHCHYLSSTEKLITVYYTLEANGTLVYNRTNEGKYWKAYDIEDFF